LADFKTGPRRKCRSVWPGSGMKQSRLLFLKLTPIVNSNPRLLPSGSKPRRREEAAREAAEVTAWRHDTSLTTTVSSAIHALCATFISPAAEGADGHGSSRWGRTGRSAARHYISATSFLYMSFLPGDHVSPCPTNRLLQIVLGSEVSSPR
jgi:hypothetical protein